MCLVQFSKLMGGKCVHLKNLSIKIKLNLHLVFKIYIKGIHKRKGINNGLRKRKTRCTEGRHRDS